MPDTQVRAALEKLPHFRNLPRELLDALAAGSRVLELRAGETIFTQGTEPTGFFAVLAGAVRVYRISPDGREQVLHHLRAGQSFAEAAVLSFGRYPAHAIATEDDSRVVEIGAATFLKLFREDPRLSAAMVGSLCMWLLSLVERIEELQVASAPSRLARYLLRLPATGAKDPLMVELPMAKKELAAHLAIAPETLSRLLRRWQDSGVVETRGRHLALLDSRVLIAIADREGEEAS
jgi:CRP/FNR family transcriptional regulator